MKEGQNHAFHFRHVWVKTPICVSVDMLSKDRGEVRAYDVNFRLISINFGGFLQMI